MIADRRLARLPEPEARRAEEIEKATMKAENVLKDQPAADRELSCRPREKLEQLLCSAGRPSALLRTRGRRAETSADSEQ